MRARRRYTTDTRPLQKPNFSVNKPRGRASVAKTPMRIQSLRTLRGPNVWSDAPAIEAVVLVEPTDYLGDSALDQLAAALPAPVAAGLDRRSTNGSQMARILGHLARAIQEESGITGLERPVTKVGPTHSEHRVVVGYRDEAVGRRAVELALGLLTGATSATPIDFGAAVAELQKLDQEVRLGPSTASLARAAETRGIPVTRLTEGSLLQLGFGSRQRRVSSA